VIENYRLVKPENARKNVESAPVLERFLLQRFTYRDPPVSTSSDAFVHST